MTSVQMRSTYGETACRAKRATEIFVADVIKALEEMYLDDPGKFLDNSRPFHVVDLGAADGVNFVPILKEIIQFCRERNENLPLKVTLNDTPWNDFSLLFQTLNKSFGKIKNLFIYGIGKSFYEQLFANEDVDLFIAATSVHWLPDIPVPVDFNCHAPYKNVLESDKGKIWISSANQAWETFLLNRSKELRRGGRIVIWSPSYSEESDIRFNRHHLVDSSFIKKLKSALAAEKIEELLPKMMLPIFYTNEAQLVGHFKDSKLGLKLQSYKEFEIPEPFFEEYKKTHNAEIYISKWAKSYASPTMNYYKAKLIENGVSSVTAEKVLSDLYENRFLELKEDFIKWEISSIRHFSLTGKKEYESNMNGYK